MYRCRKWTEYNVEKSTEYKYITYFITAVYLLGSGDTLTVPFSQSSEIKCIPYYILHQAVLHFNFLSILQTIWMSLHRILQYKYMYICLIPNQPQLG